MRLEALSGNNTYGEIAEDTLASFAGIVEHFGLYAGSYGLALERLLLDPVQVVVVGSGPEAARLEATAVARFGVNKMVMRIAPHRLVPGGIPEALAEMLLQVPPPKGADVWAMVCRGRTCCRQSPTPRCCWKPSRPGSLELDARSRRLLQLRKAPLAEFVPPNIKL